MNETIYDGLWSSVEFGVLGVWELPGLVYGNLRYLVRC